MDQQFCGQLVALVARKFDGWHGRLLVWDAGGLPRRMTRTTPKSRGGLCNTFCLNTNFCYGDLGGHIALVGWAGLRTMPVAQSLFRLSILYTHYDLLCLWGSSRTLQVCLKGFVPLPLPNLSTNKTYYVGEISATDMQWDLELLSCPIG